MSFDMDNDNCGKCGVACDPTSAKPVCIMGTCMACKSADEKFCPKVDKCVVSNTNKCANNCFRRFFVQEQKGLPEGCF